jgi:hypothetical protein
MSQVAIGLKMQDSIKIKLLESKRIIWLTQNILYPEANKRRTNSFNQQYVKTFSF